MPPTAPSTLDAGTVDVASVVRPRGDTAFRATMEP